MAKNELLDHINSFPDVESRAHFIHENCLAFTNTPELRGVIEAAAGGSGYYSRLLAASLPRPKKEPRAGAARRRRPNRPVNPVQTKGGK